MELKPGRSSMAPELRLRHCQTKMPRFSPVARTGDALAVDWIIKRVGLHTLYWIKPNSEIANNKQLDWAPSKTWRRLGLFIWVRIEWHHLCIPVQRHEPLTLTRLGILGEWLKHSPPLLLPDISRTNHIRRRTVLKSGDFLSEYCVHSSVAIVNRLQLRLKFNCPKI